MNSKQRRKSLRRAKWLQSSYALCIVLKGWDKGFTGWVTRIFNYGNFVCSLTSARKGYLFTAQSHNLRPLTPREIAKRGLQP